MYKYTAKFAVNIYTEAIRIQMKKCEGFNNISFDL